MKILVTGSKGQLGWELLRQAPDFSIQCAGIDIEDLDITREDHVKEVFSKILPDLVINPAAYTQVDKAETEQEIAFSVNRDAVGILARYCKFAGIPLIHISTDFVFDGKKSEPYVETDPVSPVSVYGRSKAEGETLVRDTLDTHLIVRTSWMYGVHGNNFVKSMLKLSKNNSTLRVVADQVGCPTFAADLAKALLVICSEIQEKQSVLWGTYHLCGSGAASWYDFAVRIFEISCRLGMTGDVAVEPITTNEYPTPAIRPAFSAMSCEKIQREFEIASPPWRESLETMLIRLRKSQ